MTNASVDGLAVEDTGSGRPLVWGHGLLSSMAQEDAVGVFDLDPETEPGFRWIRYDARGHGRSRSSGGREAEAYRWPALADDMLAVAAERDLERFVAGGASMGCATALHAAVRDPGRVEALVLVIPPTAWRTRGRQSKLYRAGARTIETVGLKPFAAFMRLTPMPAALGERAAAFRDVSIDALTRADPAVVAAVLRGAAASDLPPPEQLAGLSQPALILAWARDPGHPMSTAERLATTLPNATLHRASSPRSLDRWPERVREFLAALP